MDEKHEQMKSRKLFYCFVDFEPDPPACYVVPSSVVAKAVAESHVAWKAAPGRNGSPRKGSKMRHFLPDYETSDFRLGGEPDGWSRIARLGSR
jgi:hypothetical protein